MTARGQMTKYGQPIELNKSIRGISTERTSIGS